MNEISWETTRFWAGCGCGSSRSALINVGLQAGDSGTTKEHARVSAGLLPVWSGPAETRAGEIAVYLITGLKAGGNESVLGLAG